MLIRPFRELDTDRVFDLFKSNTVRDKRQKTGFFQYQMTPDELRIRASLNGSLVMEDNGNLVGYGIAYLVGNISALQHTDGIHAKLEKSPSDVVYIDQLCFKPGSPIYLAGRFANAWELWLQRFQPIGYVAAIPVKPWVNISSRRFMLSHGFKDYCSVKSGEVTLQLLGRPDLRVDKPSDVQIHELFGDSV